MLRSIDQRQTPLLGGVLRRLENARVLEHPSGAVLEQQPMSNFDPAAQERAATTLDDRDVSALTEIMTVLEDVGRVRDADGLYLVVTESGGSYTVDAHAGACECPDAEHRQPDGGCKHVRRVTFATGARSVPAWVDPDAVDTRLGEHVTASADADTETDAPAVATDGGEIVVAGDDGEILDEDDENDGPGYSRHREPPAQGGKEYVRCEGCGRELLVELGGRDGVLHREGCPNR